MKPALHELSITEAGARIRSGELTAVNLTEAVLAEIERLDPSINAFVTVMADMALDQARRADSEIASGVDRGPLHGIPLAVKDLVDIKGQPTLCGSALGRGHVAEADAEIVTRLEHAGAVIVGKAQTYEFAVVGPSVDLPLPPARNPWNRNHITGGSSSGSAAAVAAGMVRAAIGTDTGGSIRSPACYCGVTGLKPTYNTVSKQGIFPLSGSLDHVGPIAMCVADAAIALDAIATEDDTRRPASTEIGQDIAGLRIAYARKFFARDPEASPAIVSALDDAVSQLSLLGARIEEVELPDYKLFEDCGAVTLQAEAYQVHREWLAKRQADYGRLAYQSLASGFALSDDDVAIARDVRKRLSATLNDTILPRFDGMITANVLEAAPPFSAFDGLTPRWTAMRTLPFNVTGNPVLAVPIGFAPNDLPLGMQIVGRMKDEATICRIGHAYEMATPWAATRPALPGAH
jgi:aspartyl-tRNA(Asn)/glutamyl-tRNA(Gln) amidotransferase subunit A